MGLFKKLFGSGPTRASSDRGADAAHAAIGDMHVALVRAATETLQDCAPALGISLKGVPTEQHMMVFYELLYFFSFVSVTAGIAEGLTKSQVRKWQGHAEPLLVTTAVDTFCVHWPEDRKRNLRESIRGMLRESGHLYAACAGLFHKESPTDPSSAFGMLAETVVRDAGRQSDAECLTTVVESARRAFDRMDPRGRAAALTLVIDHANEP